MTQMPAVSLVAMPGRRLATIELAREIEKRGFTGIYCPSLGDGLGLCEAMALSIGSDVVIAHDPQNVVTLQNVQLTNLHASDFHLV